MYGYVSMKARHGVLKGKRVGNLECLASKENEIKMGKEIEKEGK
jgi:hypothetical protein